MILLLLRVEAQGFPFSFIMWTLERTFGVFAMWKSWVSRNGSAYIVDDSGPRIVKSEREKNMMFAATGEAEREASDKTFFRPHRKSGPQICASIRYSCLSKISPSQMKWFTYATSVHRFSWMGQNCPQEWGQCSAKPGGLKLNCGRRTLFASVTTEQHRFRIYWAPTDNPKILCSGSQVMQDDSAHAQSTQIAPVILAKKE